MGFYDSQVLVAKKLITKYGGPAIWRRTTKTATDESKPWQKTDGAPQDTPVTIAFLPQGSMVARLFAGSNIAVGKLRGLMAATESVVPQIDDVIVRGSQVYSLVAIDPLNVNGQVILYKLEIKD